MASLVGQPASAPAQQPQQGQPLRLLPATLADLETCTRLELEAMLATSQLARVLHPDGITDAVVAEQTAAKAKKFGIPEVEYIKGVLPPQAGDNDGDNGGDNGAVMVGYLRMYTWATDEAARIQPPYGSAVDDDKTISHGAEKESASAPRPDSDATNAAPASSDDATGLQKIKIQERAVHDGLRERHVSGKKAVYVSALMVRPEYHGKGGYGRQLLTHALDRARDLGLLVFLIAQPTALGFYQRMGLRVLETAVVDFGESSGLGEHRPSLMCFDAGSGSR
ncbi:uncharacterized protein B0I36DRAFT_324388 [Microdochium trichocladiopsis]|uniref:N-acetyltransferase domain-containing protein n=1 Tax=Microdochium trichocladiopsis TaxID=1682393 RepID=A0A9P8Y7E8_9PEZI|nr:uncharacterized protein B0I36DRAFT_324388 [Microdochium trichocladiopsis]KAH7031659.1 hypothetical protein B0I36DRAFT_324388 [Microdochium trichocladiopsis]